MTLTYQEYRVDISDSELKAIMIKQQLNSKQYFWRRLIPAALLMLSGCAVMRFYWEELMQAFHTYPSDVWYIHYNYGWFLANRAFFNIEYPVPMFILFKVLAKAAELLPGCEPGKYGGTIFTLRNWFIVNSVFLGGCGLAVVGLTHKLNCRYFHLPYSKVLWGLVLTPAFFFFSIYNYDLVTILCCVAALWLFLEKDYVGASACLGLGFAFKIYPGAMFPLFWLAMPSAQRFKSLGAFILPWAVMNIPYMRYNFGTWLYPYTWQLEFDSSEQTGHLIYHLTTFLGKIPALALAAAVFLYLLYLIWKRRPEGYTNDALWLTRCSIVLIASFIMLKNVFSPQYLLWISPFLALSGGYPFYGLYSAIELLSGLEVSGLYYWREHCPEFINCCRFLRNLTMIWVWYWTFRQLCPKRQTAAPTPKKTSKPARKKTHK